MKNHVCYFSLFVLVLTKKFKGEVDMAILSDGRLIELIADGKLKLVPFLLENIQPSSVDLRLDKLIKIPQQKQNEFIDISQDNQRFFKEFTIEDHYVLEVNQMIIGQILERIAIPRDCNAKIFNRSSLARVGLDVSTAQYINPGYEGQLPIIIKNIGTLPIKLVPGVRICQLELSDVRPSPIRDYSQRKDSKYFGEFDSLVSKIHLDREMVAFRDRADTSSNLANFINAEISKRSKNILGSLPEDLKRELGLL